MRAIDADSLINLVTDATILGDGFKQAFVAIVNGEPTIEPEQRWIPCDETVEIPDYKVLACDKYGDETLGYLEYADDQWICESEYRVMYDPIAWMEKPEPYVERRQDG